MTYRDVPIARKNAVLCTIWLYDRVVSCCASSHRLVIHDRDFLGCIDLDVTPAVLFGVRLCILITCVVANEREETGRHIYHLVTV